MDSSREKDENIARKRADLLGVRYFDTTKLSGLPRVEGFLTNQERYQYHAIILSHEQNSAIIAITAKTPQTSLKTLRAKFPDERVSFVMISEMGFNDFMKMYDPPEEVEFKDVAISADSSNANLAQVSQTIEKVRPDELFDYIVKQAVKLLASDVHFENQRDGHVQMRFRVHGVLHEIAQISKDKFRQLMSEIASQADISSSSNTTQTGHIGLQLDDNNINIRIETAPTLYGQDVVLRVFMLSKELMNLESLGLYKPELEVIEDIIEHPTGLVLSVGPTGSGKTTTLYSIINRLNIPSRKIITLEDPVEYSIDGIVQIPIKTMKKQSFADGLRAVIRMDPDVIMIGEIRDADTANTALQAALSGHLVLSTFHADDAAAALARLLTFTDGNPLFTSALRVIIAQRLVRRLHDASKQVYRPQEHIAQSIAAAIGSDAPDPKQIELYKPVPSDGFPFGYDGRTAVVEVLEMNGRMERAVHEHAGDLVADDIRDILKEEGRPNLLANALKKAINGDTTLDEVYRVI